MTRSSILVLSLVLTLLASAALAAGPKVDAGIPIYQQGQEIVVKDGYGPLPATVVAKQWKAWE